MKLTNKFNLPKPIVDAIAKDTYSKGDADISVTELIDPPMLVALKKQYADKLSEDVSERIWSLFGQVLHGILERAETEAIAERRLHIMVENWKVSGSMDRFVHHNGLLQDYKVTTVYKIKDGHIPEEWARQLNIYAEILRQNNIVVKKLQIVAFLRDWSQGLSEREPSVPNAQVVVIDIPLVDSKEVQEYILECVREHQEAQLEGNMRPCTKEERWARPDTWAIMKKGQKRAVRVVNSKKAAEVVVEDLGKDHSVVFREGESVRCQKYCPARKFCKTAKERGWVK